MESVCQACESVPVEVKEPNDNENSPYLLCSSCHDRLLELSLRPREWYNLAKRFGWWQFSLHDDFYEDNGEASQPEDEVVDAELYPAPSLEDVCGDLPKLISHVLTRWNPEKEIYREFGKFAPERIEAELRKALPDAPNDDVAGAYFDICGEVLKGDGARFVRSGWECADRIPFGSLAFATTQCVPFEEGFSWIESRLAAMPMKEMVNRFYVLSYYRSPRALKWVEENVEAPLTASWGRLVACSKPRWLDIEAWLDKGRPHSLVALDALKACARPDTPLLREMNLKPLELPSDDRIAEVLSRYLEQDSVPRVQQFIEPFLGKLSEYSKLWRSSASL